MTLSTRIHPEISMMQKLNLPIALPRTLAGVEILQGNKETLSIDVSLLKNPQRFAKCDT